MTRGVLSRRPDRFLLLIALAHAGGVIAYVPYLLLLLPARMAVLAPAARVEWLGIATLAGAISASIANLAFGCASDHLGSRRRWAAAGLGGTVAGYALLHGAATPGTLVGAIIVYQVMLNMLLAPLTAWAADRVPDSRKGLLGGLFSAGQPIAMLAGVLVTLPLLPQPWLRMVAVIAMVVVLVLPVLAAFPRHHGLASTTPQQTARPRARGTHRDFALLCIARLLVQVACSTLFGFLLYYFLALPGPPSEAAVARLSAVSMCIAFPVALAIGRLSDRIRRRKPFLIGAVVLAACGLALMAAGGGMAMAAAGYALFTCASNVFLSLQTGFAMQLLPSPIHRGRDLGLLNLANTVPAMIAPLLAIWLVPEHGFAPLFVILAGMTLLGGVCIHFVQHDEQST